MSPPRNADYRLSSPHELSAANQCRLLVCISATYQCHQSVLPISVINECCLSVPISDACQCPVPTISVHQC
ncbi:unnamed protein product, partial [Staurois parvus]